MHLIQSGFSGVVGLLLLGALFGGAAASLPAQGPSALISASKPPVAGQVFRVDVTPLSGRQATVLVELNQVRLNAVITPQPNGKLLVTVQVPAAAVGGSLSVTVTVGGSPSLQSWTVLAP